jgi:hypothetical protein
LYVISQVEPTCVADPATVVFGASGTPGPLSVVKISNSIITQTGDNFLFSATSVQSGMVSNYAVVNGLGCMSPMFSFSYNASISFSATVTTIKNPCSDNSDTGKAVATVTPAGLAVVITWVNIKTNQVVLVGPVLENALAGGYRVTFVALSANISACTIVVNYKLTTSPGPTLTPQRVSVPKTTLDTFSLFAVSSNGPPYSFSITGLSTNTVPTPFVSIIGTTPIGTLLINNLPQQETIKITVEDSGKCLSTYLSVGHIVPIPPVPPPHPTPAPNATAIQETPRGPISVLALFLSVMLAIEFLGVVVFLVTSGKRRR